MNTNTNDKMVEYFNTSMFIAVGGALMVFMIQQLLQLQPVQGAAAPEGYGMWYFGPAGLIMNVENGLDEQPLYIGEAAPGTLDSDAGWRIYRYNYVIDPATGDMLSGTIRYANGTSIFDKVWDNRAEYVYG